MWPIGFTVINNIASWMTFVYCIHIFLYLGLLCNYFIWLQVDMQNVVCNFVIHCLLKPQLPLREILWNPTEGFSCCQTSLSSPKQTKNSLWISQISFEVTMWMLMQHLQSLKILKLFHLSLMMGEILLVCLRPITLRLYSTYPKCLKIGFWILYAWVLSSIMLLSHFLRVRYGVGYLWQLY